MQEKPDLSNFGGSLVLRDGHIYTKVEQFVKDGVNLTYIPCIHMGPAEYFRSIEDELDSHDKVLYEGGGYLNTDGSRNAAGWGLKKDEKEKASVALDALLKNYKCHITQKEVEDSSGMSIGQIYEKIVRLVIDNCENELGYVLQWDVTDYQKPNWKYSDASPDEDDEEEEHDIFKEPDETKKLELIEDALRLQSKINKGKLSSRDYAQLIAKYYSRDYATGFDWESLFKSRYAPLFENFSNSIKSSDDLGLVYGAGHYLVIRKRIESFGFAPKSHRFLKAI